MKAYSQDFRQRVLQAIDTGENQATVAQTFRVSVATIKRYRHRNDERWDMSCPKQFLVGLRSKGPCYKPIYEPNCKRIPT